MASLSAVLAEVNSLPVTSRSVFTRIFSSFLGSLRFGHAKGTQPDPLENFSGGFFHGTTPATPGEEFSLAHNFGRVPYLAIPCLRLDTVGSSTAPLQVSRAADTKRIYFTSTLASAPVSVIVEG